MGLGMKLNLKLFMTSTAIGAVLGGGAFAADAVLVVDDQQFEARYEAKPAVSALNGKIEAAYTWIDIDGLGNVDLWTGAASVSVPVSHSFGIQIDAGIGRFTGDASATAYGIAGHAFWRNPDFALLGLYADYQTTTDFDLDATRIGLEGELYLDRISLEGFAGAELVDTPGGDETFFSGEALAAFYITDDFRVHGGVGHRFDETYGIVGAEAMLPFGGNNVALFTDGVFADAATSVRGGVRIYFGESGKSLKARHREDDPRVRLFDATGGFMAGDDDDVIVCEPPYEYNPETEQCGYDVF